MEAIKPKQTSFVNEMGIKLKQGAKIYLAIPYTGMEERSYEIANHVTSQLVNKGYIVFSPISMFHSVAINHNLPTEFEFWEKIDTEFIMWCDYVMVVNSAPFDSIDRGIELIKESKGVQFEIALAKKFNKYLLNYIYES